jgi:predicted dehydrogenase
MQEIRFGFIGCGFMGREFAGAAARWPHLLDLDFRPVVVAACDLNLDARSWFERSVSTLEFAVDDYRRLLERDDIDAVYCAVPHHLHEQLYVDILQSGKHLLGEKPFGIDLEACRRIVAEAKSRPDQHVRCVFEQVFHPGFLQLYRWAREKDFGAIIDVEAGTWHNSDLNPDKPASWKRRAESNGRSGCLNDLGMHALGLPFRLGWRPLNVRALLSNVIPERPDGRGGRVPCDTFDNAILACEVEQDGKRFPMTVSIKRIAPGHTNTVFLHVNGTQFSARYNLANPKELASLSYTPGGAQAWQVEQPACPQAYPSVTPAHLEFSFSDCVLHMFAAYCDELVNGSAMRQPFHCATPREALDQHTLYAAALASQETGETVTVEYEA